MAGDDGRARVDPRVLRTRALLQDALLGLAQEKPFSEITVADVADRATVNRSTFYQHYPDTDTLLADALDQQAARFGMDAATTDPDAPPDEPPPTLVQYAALISEHRDLYRAALGPHGSLVAVNRLHERFRRLAVESMRLRGTRPAPSDIPEGIFAAGVSGTVISVFTAWLQMDPLPPPEDVARWAWLLVTGRTVAAGSDHTLDAYG
jgi:AcrR family transcriptional regulator